MDFKIEVITPAKAQAYLETSRGNRPISKPSVKSYADTMKADKWQLNGIPIVFDSEGHLLDGHHRMEGVKLAGVPVAFAVVRGVAAEAFTTFDCGLHRKLGQLLAMQGVPNYNCVSATVSTNVSLMMTGRIQANNGTRHGRFTNNDFYEYYSLDPQGYQEVSKYGKNLYDIGRILKASWISGLVYYLTHTGGYDEAYVKKFFDALCHMETSGISAADVLRYYIVTNDRKKNSTRIKADHLFALVTKAWNFYVTGRVVKKINFNAEKEEYPRLILKQE